MLSPRPLLRPSLLPSRLCAQCLRRLQSTTSREPSPPKDALPSDSLISEDLQPHHRRISQVHPLVPSYPSRDPNRPSSNAKARPAEKEDSGFSPALTGFVAGVTFATGGIFVLYHMLGNARIVKANSERHQRLVEERTRLFPPLRPGSAAGALAVGGREGNPSDTLLEEQVRWFGSAAHFYAAYVPGADTYLSHNLAELRKARSTPKGEVAVAEIIRNCAREIDRQIGGGDLGLSVGKQCWDIMMRHVEMVVDVAEEGRNIPEDVREKVQQQLEGLRKVGSRAGRRERRLLEERAMEEAKKS